MKKSRTLNDELRDGAPEAIHPEGRNWKAVWRRFAGLVALLGAAFGLVGLLDVYRSARAEGVVGFIVLALIGFLFFLFDEAVERDAEEYRGD